MIENQYKSNCRYIETQNLENNNIPNEYCCQTTKINSSSNSSSCCSNDPISEAKSFL